MSSNGKPQDGGPDQSIHDLPEYGVLVRQYGEALLRISQLESQLDLLSKGLEYGEHPQVPRGAVQPGQGTPGLRGLADWIDALQNLFAETPWSAPAPGPDDSESTFHRADNRLIHEDELRQLRVQAATMEHRLARSEQGGETKRRGRQGGGRSMWQRVTRSVGFR